MTANPVHPMTVREAAHVAGMATAMAPTAPPPPTDVTSEPATSTAPLPPAPAAPGDNADSATGEIDKSATLQDVLRRLQALERTVAEIRRKSGGVEDVPLIDAPPIAPDTVTDPAPPAATTPG